VRLLIVAFFARPTALIDEIRDPFLELPLSLLIPFLGGVAPIRDDRGTFVHHRNHRFRFWWL
jgi:hypothetical protein